MRYSFIYENNRGQKINLTEYPYFLNVEPLLDYSWSYTTKEKRRGNIVAGFAKDIETTDLTLHILATNEDRKNEAIDTLNNCIEADIYDGIKGKIIYGDWYTWGYIVSAKNSKWQYDKPLVKKTLTLVREQANWYRITRSANYGDAKPTYNFQEEDIKTFEIDLRGNNVYEGYNYDFDYMTDIASQKVIVNPNASPCDFVITIQGYVNRPEIEIGNNILSINAEVPYGAFLQIDSSKKTAVLTLADGKLINVFGARNPNYYLFQRIPVGKNVITWNGSYLWEIQMLEERSEPLWHTV